MKRFLQIWERVFFEEYNPSSLLIFRIFLGVSIGVYLILEFPNWERFYSSFGMLSLNEPNLIQPSLDKFSLFHWAEGKIPITVLWWIGFIGSICFTAGLFTRASNFILYLILSSMSLRNPVIQGGYDLVFRLLLFYSLFTPLNYYFSIDNLFKKTKKKFPLIWPIRLMQLNIASIYILTALYKILADKSWINGDVIFWVITNFYWSKFPFPELFYMWNGILSKFFTYFTLFIELAFPFLIWFKKTRFIILILITIFHILIAIAIPYVLVFSMVMICSFWLFVSPEVSQKWLSKINVNV